MGSRKHWIVTIKRVRRFLLTLELFGAYKEDIPGSETITAHSHSDCACQTEALLITPYDMMRP